MAKRSRPSAVCLPHGSPFAVWWRRRSPRRSAVQRRSSTADRYTGVRKLRSVPELRRPIDAQLFFERFVATRTPVIVRGGVHRETMAVLTDDAALEAAAGDCQLQVEVRAGAADAFGKGNRRRMRFGALLRKVAQGATQYYLTTQELPQLRGGGEQLVGPPLSRLPGLGLGRGLGLGLGPGLGLGLGLGLGFPLCPAASLTLSGRLPDPCPYPRPSSPAASLTLALAQPQP